MGLLGPNGAGKSTAFGIMAGRDSPSKGRVKFEGMDITNLGMEKRARLGIAYLPQVRGGRNVEFCVSFGIDFCFDFWVDFWVDLVRFRVS